MSSCAAKQGSEPSASLAGCPTWEGKAGEGWGKSMPQTQQHFVKPGSSIWRGIGWAFIFCKKAEQSNKWLLWNTLPMDMGKWWVPRLQPVSTATRVTGEGAKSPSNVQPHHGEVMPSIPCPMHCCIQPQVSSEEQHLKEPPFSHPPQARWVNATCCFLISAEWDLAAEKATERWSAHDSFPFSTAQWQLLLSQHSPPPAPGAQQGHDLHCPCYGASSKACGSR